MKKYVFEPKACYNENGITYRPFYIDNKEVFRLDLSIMLGEDKSASNLEMVKLCEVIKNETGLIVSIGELPELIKNRIITVE
jgi:hypothetical protein